jgi:hypothetical protein
MIGNGANTVQVAPIDLLGNAPLGKTRSQFLSDHFGMAATLRLITKVIQTITIRSYADISTMTNIHHMHAQPRCALPAPYFRAPFSKITRNEVITLMAASINS